jgi:hypothetical protein
MKKWNRDFHREDENGWEEDPENGFQGRRLRKSRKRKRNDRDFYERRTPRVRSTWE